MLNVYSMLGSKRAEARRTVRSEIGTSGTMARPTIRAKRSLPITGGPLSERERPAPPVSSKVADSSVDLHGLSTRDLTSGTATPS